MEKIVSDVIADFIVKQGITDVFCLVGGGSMFLNHSIGFKKSLRVTYCQHEQACAMAAEGYVRASGKIAAVCVTTGPGGTNTITGLLGAYQDNYPMIVISGQVRKETGIQSTGLPLRFMGEQEHDIVTTVKNLTKYAKYVDNPDKIVYELQKAIYIAEEGRKGPVWLDIPMDVQNSIIETDGIQEFIPHKSMNDNWDKKVFLGAIHGAKRPVILAGSGIRSTGYVEKFRRLADKMNIPVVAATYNADLFTNSDKIYFGNFGIIGGRPGNFIMQNADLIIGIGCRMTFRQIGFNYNDFSPSSKRMIVDVDENELKKPTLKIDIPIHADLKKVIDDLLDTDDAFFKDSIRWLEYCEYLKKKYPIYNKSFDVDIPNEVNPYYFGKEIKKYLKEDTVIVLGNSTIAAHIIQLGIDKPNQRIINNMNCGSMGYDLPAAIGACRATGKPVTLITGDGSIMLNLQELMTARYYNLPIRIFISCNGGYRGVIRSQTNMFNGEYTGCSPDTGVGLPDFEKIAKAFEIPFMKIKGKDDVDSVLEQVYADDSLQMIEWPQDPSQKIEPRTVTKRDDNGKIISTPIDDLSPFLQEDEYKNDQYDTWNNK